MTYKCHDGVRIAFAGEGVELYGASLTAAEGNFNRVEKGFDLVISLTFANFKIRKSKVVEGEYLTSVGYKELTKITVDVPEVLRLHWQDYGVPDLDEDFWNRLARVIRKKGQDRLRRRKGKGVYRVMVHCMGGHGRTGTCLSILANKVIGIEGDLVEQVRKAYCNHAVENKSQIEYVEKMTGMKCKESTKGSKNLGNSKGSLERYTSAISDEEWERLTKKYKSEKEKEGVKGVIGTLSTEPRSLVDGILMTKSEEREYRKRNK